MDDNLFFEIFEDINDPRVIGRTKYPLSDILFMTIAAVIGGADKWPEIQLFYETKIDWFKKFLTLEQGIPSHDTFERVFSIINPKELGDCFAKWVNTLSNLTNGEIIPIDGKTVKGSFTESKTNKSAIHIVSAWASEAGIALGQEAVA